MRVFAVEDTAVQVVWSSLPAPAGVLAAGPTRVEIEAAPPAWARFRLRGTRRLGRGPTGPGGVVLAGLEPGREYPLTWTPAGGSSISLGTVRTLRPPGGEALARFATISDLHIGERAFGVVNGIRDVGPVDRVPYPVRAARAALAEARDWGAGTVVAKGDVTDQARPAQFAAVAELLVGSGMRPFVQLGNHDCRHRVDAASHLGDVPVAGGGRPVVIDLPGVRVVLGDSPSPADRRGHLDDDQIQRIEAAVRDSPHPAVVSLHHPPERWPVPTSYPPGILHGDSRRLVGALAAAGAALVIAGHTHRNRTYLIGRLTVAEVGSTKDYPGGWAGYSVHEGGIRQVVRRTMAPDVIAWTEATAQAAGGLWGRWSPGRTRDRCWSLAWTRR